MFHPLAMLTRFNCRRIVLNQSKRFYPLYVSHKFVDCKYRDAPPRLFSTRNKKYDKTAVKESDYSDTNEKAISEYDDPTRISSSKHAQQNVSSSSQHNDSSKTRTIDVVRKDAGLLDFLGRVYRTTAVGIMGGLGTASIMAYSGLAGNVPFHLMGIGTVVSLGCCFWFDRLKKRLPKNFTVVETLANEHEHASTYTNMKLCFAGISMGMGTVLAPLVVVSDMVSPMIFPQAAILSLCTMAGASLYAYHASSASLIKWGAPLCASLMGFVGMGLVSLGSTLIMGPNAFSEVWMQVDTYGGIVLFSALTAYDTHEAIESYHEGERNPLSSAIQLYLNFMNLLTRFIIILLESKRKN